MEFIEWHETYALGFPEIDDDHRAIFNILNDIMSALNDKDWEQCKRLSADFVLALKRHYPREERFLKKIGFSDLEKHTGHHRQMLEGAEKFAHLCETETDGERLEERLEELVSALLKDVRGGDLNFRTYLLEKGLDKALSDRRMISIWL